MSKFSDKLKEIYEEYKKKYGITTYYEFSKLTKIPAQTLGNYMNRGVIPRKFIRRELVEKLGCKYEDLFDDNEDPRTDFTERIDLIANKYWITCNDIAKFSNVGYKNLVTMHCGSRKPTPKVCYNISKTFNVSIEWLVGNAPVDRYDMTPIFDKLDYGSKKQILGLMLSMLEKEDDSDEQIQSDI